MSGIEGIHKWLVQEGPMGMRFVRKLGSTQAMKTMGVTECSLAATLALGVLYEVNPPTRDRDLLLAKRLSFTCMRMYVNGDLGLAGEVSQLTEKGVRCVNSSCMYLQRPDAVKALYYLNQITGDPIYREWGWRMWEAIEKVTKKPFGLCQLGAAWNRESVRDVMESGVLSELLKYFYLLFKDERLIDFSTTILNSKSHPFFYSSVY